MALSKVLIFIKDNGVMGCGMARDTWDSRTDQYMKEYLLREGLMVLEFLKMDLWLFPGSSEKDKSADSVWFSTKQDRKWRVNSRKTS